MHAAEVTDLRDDRDVFRKASSELADRATEGLFERFIVAGPKRLFEDVRTGRGWGQQTHLGEPSPRPRSQIPFSQTFKKFWKMSEPNCVCSTSGWN